VPFWEAAAVLEFLKKRDWFDWLIYGLALATITFCIAGTVMHRS
jgi:hypothetical protein